MQTTVSPRYALVTGAGSGLGRAFCLRLASDGYTVAVTDINLTAAQATLAEVQADGGTGLAEQLDVTNADAWRVLQEKLRNEWPRFDLLVNNAGVCVVGEIGEVALADIQFALAVNFSGVLNGCHTMLPWMKELAPGGNIINVASIFGLVAPPSLVAYNTSKAAVVALSETLYGELRPCGIGVTVVAPGFFSSQLLEQGRFATTTQRTIAGRYTKKARISAEDVADQALRTVLRGRLYVVLGSRARWTWRIKRWLPGSFAKLIAWKYHRQLQKQQANN